jgi:RimJ/RimL family protein N-acetyltransferase
VVVGHRASNEASRRAIQRHGFTPTGSTPHLWPDGTEEAHVNYEFALR